MTVTSRGLYAYLTILTGNRAGTNFPLDARRNTLIGRISNAINFLRLCIASSKRQPDDCADPILRIRGLGKYLQIEHAATNRYLHEMGENKSQKRSPLPLPILGQCLKANIVRDDRPP